MLAQEDTTTHYEQEENFPQTANDQEPIEELLFPTDLVESESQKSLDIDKIEEIEKIETIGLLAQVDPKEEPTPEISVVKPVKEKPIVAKKKPIIQETKNKIKPLPAKTLAKTKNPVPRKKIKVNQPKNELKKLDALIGAAYKNFQIGHILIAKEKYQEALRLAPDNRDVLLGNAAVAMAEQEYAYALELYHNRLAIDPSDEYALSGIISISSLGNPSPDLMTRVNKLISTHPNATHLHFMKGSMEAANNQWPAAKKSFSIAWYKQPNKIEYTYNLAIALDHLNETQEAIRLYRSTLELAGHNSNSLIDIQSVISRLKILARRND